jgi:5-methylcytosine-specific restriction endonuclease McrA
MTRYEIFARDEYRCVYCGQLRTPEELTVDHVQARSRGGDRSGGNLVTACKACNIRKGRRKLAHFLADDAAAYANFRRLATHVWKRHRLALEEEIRKSRRETRTADRSRET